MIPIMAIKDPIWIIVHVDQYREIRSSPSQNCRARMEYASMTTITVETETHPRHMYTHCRNRFVRAPGL